jgi:hypothetical protein
MPSRGAFAAALAALAALAAAPAASAQDYLDPAAFAPGAPAGRAPVDAAAPTLPEENETLGDPFDPRLRLDLPGLSFRPIDPGSAAPALLGVDGRRVLTTLAGLRISSLLAPAHDAAFHSHLTNGPLHLHAAAGPDSGALRGDALGGTLELVLPEPPADPYRPTDVNFGARAGWAGDFGGLSGHLRVGVQVEDFQATASLAGSVLGLTDGLSIDDSRMGEALAGDALFDLRTAVTDEDALRMILRVDGASGLVRGGDLQRGFLRLDDGLDTMLAALYRHGEPGPGSVTAWSLARTAARSLLAFEPGANRWSTSTDTLWVVAAGLAASFGERWWSFDLSGELRAEGLAASLSRGFADGGGTWDDRMGDWPYRPALDGSSRAGGTLGATAGFRLGRDVDLTAAVSLLVYRLFLPVDPFGQQDPERYAETESWEAEPTADLGVTWEIGEGLALDLRFETGARPADIEQLAAAGIDPAARIRWIPSYVLRPERSYGGQVGFRFELGIVDLRLAYHVQWIDGAVTAGPVVVPNPTQVLAATWRNTEEFVQGGALSGTVYLDGDWPMRFLLESSHGWAEDGWNGEYRPLDLAPLSFLLEFAYRPQEGQLEAGIYGGYRWRPDDWQASPVEERLAASCTLAEARCDERETIPLGLYLRWAFWRTLAMVARAGGLSFQGDGPSIQAFLTGSF